MWYVFGAILLDFPTCHLNSCNFGQNYNLIFFLGKQNQEILDYLGRLVLDYFLSKMLVTYDSLMN